MALKYNPFTGSFDQVGSGGGGSSYIDGEVATYADLPVTVGTPAVDSAYLVRTASGSWGGLVNRRPAGIYVRTANAGALSDWTYASAFPDVFNASNFLLYDNADSSKNLQFSVSGITTGTTRTLTVPNASGTIATEEGMKSLPAGSLWDDIRNQDGATSADGILQINNAALFGAQISAQGITAGRTYTLPDASGTILLGSLNLANLTNPATALVNLGLLAAFRNASVLAPSSDTTVTSTVTPANVAGMSFSVTANTSYAILFLGNITHGGNGFDVRVDFPSLFNMGSGVTGWGIGVLASGASGAIAGVSSTNVRLGTRGGTASTQQMFAMAVLTVAATGGTANFQFCQNSSGATNSTLLASSKALILPL